MILIRFLLTSVIFGTRRRNKVLGQVQYQCQQCGRKAYHTIVRTRNWFALYFIPIIPLPKVTTARCNLCGFQQPINNDTADAMFAQAQPKTPATP